MSTKKPGAAQKRHHSESIDQPAKLRRGNRDNSIVHSSIVNNDVSNALADLKIDDSDVDIKFVFVGTGTSTGLPHAQCYLAKNIRDACRACKACYPDADPKGYKNKRANTGAAMKIKDKHGNGGEFGLTFTLSSLTDT